MRPEAWFADMVPLWFARMSRARRSYRLHATLVVAPVLLCALVGELLPIRYGDSTRIVGICV